MSTVNDFYQAFKFLVQAYIYLTDYVSSGLKVVFSSLGENGFLPISSSFLHIHYQVSLSLLLETHISDAYSHHLSVLTLLLSMTTQMHIIWCCSLKSLITVLFHATKRSGLLFGLVIIVNMDADHICCTTNHICQCRSTIMSGEWLL